MKVYMCALVVVAAAASAVSTSQPASQAAQASPTAQTTSSSSSSSQGTPSQVANKRGDTDFATSASQQQPVYSPSISQQPSSHSQSPSAADHQSSASNRNLYYYYYPSDSNAGKSDSVGSDPYLTSAASSYPTYASEASSHGPQHSGYDSSASSYGGATAYQGQFQQAYAQQGHSGSPQYSYGGHLLPSDSQINAQYSSGSGAPVTGYQSQPSYPQQGTYQTAPSNYQPTYAAPADSKSRFYGLGSVIMPLVGLGALAFLLPSVTNLGGKKKTKRSVESVESNPNKANSVAEYAERLEKYFKIYRAAVESEDCMNRIFCEVGDAVSTVRGKAALLALFEKVAPQWMTGKMGVFKFGALSDKSAKCARYKCA